MGGKSWKSGLLIAILILLIAGLQGGAIWIMTNLRHQPGLPKESSTGRLNEAPLAVASLKPAAEEKPAAPIRQTIPLRRDKTPTATPPLIPLNPSATLIEAASSPLSPFLARNLAAIADKSASLKDKESRPEVALKEEMSNQTKLGQEEISEPIKPTGEQNQPSKSTQPMADSSELQEPTWLQTRNPKHYTLQLHRSKDLSELKDFVKNNALHKPLAYYRTSAQSGAWYVLVVGDYPDAKSASAALAELNTKLPKLKPWLRDFSKIQAQLH